MLHDVDTAMEYYVQSDVKEKSDEISQLWNTVREQFNGIMDSSNQVVDDLDLNNSLNEEVINDLDVNESNEGFETTKKIQINEPKKQNKRTTVIDLTKEDENELNFIFEKEDLTPSIEDSDDNIKMDCKYLKKNNKVTYTSFQSNYIHHEGDWACKNCDNMNFGWRESCRRCSQPKIIGEIPKIENYKYHKGVAELGEEKQRFPNCFNIIFSVLNTLLVDRIPFS